MRNDTHAYWIHYLFILLGIIKFTSPESSQIISKIFLRVSSSLLATFTEVSFDVTLSLSQDSIIETYTHTHNENSLVVGGGSPKMVEE